MPAPFARTTRSLEAETRGRSALSLGVAAALLGAWVAWFSLARVSIYEVGEARIEVDRVAHGVEVEVSGRVVEQRLALDQAVEAGDVLVVLDASVDQHKLAETRAQLRGIEAQMSTLAEQMKTTERLSAARQTVLSAKVDEAQAYAREADSGAAYADAEAARAARLHAEGLLSEADSARLSADATAKRAEADARRRAAARAAAELPANAGELALEIARLGERRAELEARRDLTAAAIETLEHTIERHRIRAPIAGRIGEVAVIPPGTMLEKGARVASIVPAGELRAVAELSPRGALGRVRPGQRARVRIDGFAWIEYGSIPATVTTVAAEVRDGKARVELGLSPDPASPIPRQHGLPGTVEIEIERISPASLVLRAAGRYLRPEGGAP